MLKQNSAGLVVPHRCRQNLHALLRWDAPRALTSLAVMPRDCCLLRSNCLDGIGRVMPLVRLSQELGILADEFVEVARVGVGSKF